VVFRSVILIWQVPSYHHPPIPPLPFLYSLERLRSVLAERLRSSPCSVLAQEFGPPRYLAGALLRRRAPEHVCSSAPSGGDKGPERA